MRDQRMGARALGIDGRQLVTKAHERDAYESPAVRVLAVALVALPLALVVWFAYVSGTWMGGVWGGVASVLTTLATVGVFWAWKKLRRRAR